MVRSSRKTNESLWIDQTAVYHSVAVVNVPHIRTVGLDSAWLHGIPISITEVSFCQRMVHVGMHTCPSTSMQSSLPWFWLFQFWCFMYKIMWHALQFDWTVPQFILWAKLSKKPLRKENDKQFMSESFHPLQRFFTVVCVAVISSASACFFLNSHIVCVAHAVTKLQNRDAKMFCAF
jgi:hypothetical protein